MMGVQERIQKFIKHLGIKPKDFEKVTGMSNGSCSKLNDAIRKSTCNRISTAYPELNIDWLLTGEGEMLKPPAAPAANIVHHTTNNGNITQTTNTTTPENPQVKIENERLRAENALLKEQNDKLLAIIAAKNT